MLWELSVKRWEVHYGMGIPTDLAQNATELVMCCLHTRFYHHWIS